MRVIDYIEELQTAGKLWFTKVQALADLGCTEISLKRSLDKLKQKKRLVVIRGFILIVPVEYKDWGVIPADWFIDPLMQYLQVPYYIALLSAGQFYGAAHQKPMQFQVMTNKFIRDIKVGRVHIKFIECAQTALLPTRRVQVKTGYASLANPETICLDLCRNYKASGYWSNIATVLTELLESLDINKLCELATSGIYELPVTQRLGLILSCQEVQGQVFANALYHRVNVTSFRWIALNPGHSRKNSLKNEQWKVIVNENIEVDL